MDIRLLEPADAESAVTLRRLALTTDSYAFAERPGSDLALNVEFVRERFADSGIRAGAVVIGAFDPELIGVVGVSLADADSADARLWGFYVEPGHRGCGIGRALIDRALYWAEQMSAQRVELSVSDASRAAIHLYDSAGFSTVEILNGKRRMMLALSSETALRESP